MALYNQYLPQQERGGGGEGLLSGLKGLLKGLGLDGLDTGDLLLMLVLLLLYQDKKDEDWLMVLALVFFIG